MLERFQELDQRTLVLIAERLLFLQKARAEVVSLVDNIIGTFADLDQIRNEVLEHLSGFCVVLAFNSLEIFFHLEQELGEIELVGLKIDVGEQTDGCALWNRSDPHALFAEKPRKQAREPVVPTEQLVQRIG